MYFDQLYHPILGAKHKETCQAIFSGKMTSKEAAKKMQEAADSLKKK